MKGKVVCGFNSVVTPVTIYGQLQKKCEVYTVQRETFEGENFREFRGFVAICESFLHEFLRHGIFWGGGKSEQSVKVFSMKIVFFTNSQTFSPPKVFCYIRYMHKFQNFISGTFQ